MKGYVTRSTSKALRVPLMEWVKRNGLRSPITEHHGPFHAVLDLVSLSTNVIEDTGILSKKHLTQTPQGELR